MKRARKSMNRWRRDAKGLTGVIYRLSASLKSMASTAIIGAPIAIVYGLRRAAMAGEEFNQALRRSQAIMGDLSVTMRRDMERAALEVAAVTKFSAKEAAQSYFYLASAGLSAEQSLRALPSVARFAQAGMFDMALATDLLTDAQSALGLTVKDAGENMRNMNRVSDALVAANTKANASVQQFSEALTNKAAAALRFVNKDIEEGVAVLAAFADQGIKGADAGTALEIVLRDLSTKAILNAEAFAKMRIGVYDARKEMRNMADIMADLEVALADLAPKEKTERLLSLGIPLKSIAYTKLLLGMSENIREYEAGIRSAGLATKEVADKQLTAWEKASANMGAAWTELGDAMQPVIAMFAHGVNILGDFTGGVAVLTDKVNALGRSARGNFYIAAVTAGNISKALWRSLPGTEKVRERQEALRRTIDNLRASWVRMGRDAYKVMTELAQIPKDIFRWLYDPILPKQKRPLDAGEERKHEFPFAREIAQERVALATPQEKFQWEIMRLNRIFHYGLHHVELYQRGIAAAQKALDDATGATERHMRIQDRIRQIMDAVKTPLERFKEAANELMALLREGLPLETYRRAYEQLVLGMQKTVSQRQKPHEARAFFDPRQVAIGGVPLHRRAQEVKSEQMHKDLGRIEALLRINSPGGALTS